MRYTGHTLHTLHMQWDYLEHQYELEKERGMAQHMNLLENLSPWLRLELCRRCFIPRCVFRLLLANNRGQPLDRHPLVLHPLDQTVPRRLLSL